ncbi:MAG: alpha/beta family hydrolase, partial [Polyangiaceae bacterium]
VGGTKVFRDLAAGLSSRGIVVLRYEKRTTAHAQEAAKETTFTFRDDTIDDARLAIAMLRKLPVVDKTKVFVIGHGEGGRLAPELAKEDPTLAGLVIAAASVKSVTSGLPPSYAKSLRKYRAEEAARKTKMPVLVVTGDRDSECTATDFRKWKSTLKASPHAETKLLPGLNHLFVSGSGRDDNGRPANVAPELVDAIARFITR